MIDFDSRYKITMQEQDEEAVFYKGINQKRLFLDTYISKRLPLLKYSNLVSGKINSFIKEINIDCLSGKRMAMDGAIEPYCLRFDDECIGYVTQIDGEKIPISKVPKKFFLFCKPKAVVSKEGIVLFYHDMNIIATITGKDWYFLSFDVEWVENLVKKEIESIQNISPDYNMTTIQFKMTDGTIETFELCFDLEFLTEDEAMRCYLSSKKV